MARTMWTCNGSCNSEGTSYVFLTLSTLESHIDEHHITEHHITEHHINKSQTNPDPKIVYNMEQVARKFHEVYEKHAPEFGYSTREESRVSWEMLPAQHKLLMMAAVVDVFEDLGLEMR